MHDVVWDQVNFVSNYLFIFSILSFSIKRMKKKKKWSVFEVGRFRSLSFNLIARNLSDNWAATTTPTPMMTQTAAIET